MIFSLFTDPEVQKVYLLDLDEDEDCCMHFQCHIFVGTSQAFYWFIIQDTFHK